MKRAVLVSLPLEIAVIEWGAQSKKYMEQPVGPTASKSRNNTTPTDEEEVETTIVTGANNATVSVTSLRKQAGNIKKITALYGETEEKKKKYEQGPPANV